MEGSAYNARYDSRASNNPFAPPELHVNAYEHMERGDERRYIEQQNDNSFNPNFNNNSRQNNNAYVNACERAANLSSALLSQGNKFLQQNHLIGEGPKPLRAFCFLGGLMLVISSVFSILNIFSFLSGPCTYILHIYLTILGLITMVIEAKDIGYLEHFKPFIYEWCKFLTVPGGKGIFYFFNGSIAVSLLSSNILSLISGLYMATFGVICILVHLGLRNQIVQAGIEVESTPTAVEG